MKGREGGRKGARGRERDGTHMLAYCQGVRVNSGDARTPMHHSFVEFGCYETFKNHWKPLLFQYKLSVALPAPLPTTTTTTTLTSDANVQHNVHANAHYANNHANGLRVYNGVCPPCASLPYSTSTSTTTINYYYYY